MFCKICTRLQKDEYGQSVAQLPIGHVGRSLHFLPKILFFMKMSIFQLEIYLKYRLRQSRFQIFSRGSMPPDPHRTWPTHIITSSFAADSIECVTVDILILCKNESIQEDQGHILLFPKNLNCSFIQNFTPLCLC